MQGRRHGFLGGGRIVGIYLQNTLKIGRHRIWATSFSNPGVKSPGFQKWWVRVSTFPGGDAPGIVSSSPEYVILSSPGRQRAKY